MKTINGVAIPGQWLTTEYVLDRQARTFGTEPAFKHCHRCDQKWLREHCCPFDPQYAARQAVIARALPWRKRSGVAA